jgi:WD40 repeat protein
LAKFDADALSLKVTGRLRHPFYSANSWLLRPGLSPNGVYLAAPSITGAVVVFNLDSGKVGAVLRDHEECEVRQISFHPEIPFLVSCGDDGRVKIRFSQ